MILRSNLPQRYFIYKIRQTPDEADIGLILKITPKHSMQISYIFVGRTRKMFQRDKMVKSV